ncbi:hypothetical protein [Xylophilus sp. GOD-11R]|uniref:hypothetical protein n=1 Tax=Xylophilus sp. GOD-11R TaxID=3089814 RepID=UPI00298D3A94|nr:hypothetical protein [Xylophilus sp. GOD-11R]WPB55696.1 hypothetical protein R9X41_16315 [Xylophilus sp. GOD-11R]
MNAIDIGTAKTPSWPGATESRRHGSSDSAFQASLDRSDARGATRSNPIDSPDETVRNLARLDVNTNTRLEQSQFDKGSPSTIQAPGRLPPPPAAFTESRSSDPGMEVRPSVVQETRQRIDIDRDGTVDDSETDELQQMIQAAMSGLQITAPGRTFAPLTSEERSGPRDNGDTSTAALTKAEQSDARRRDPATYGQEASRQYLQVSAGQSASSSAGSRVDLAA